VGDIALLGRGDTAFLAGLGSFLGAHVGYTTAFVSAGRPWRDRSGWQGVAAAAALCGTLAPVACRAAGRQDPRLRWPVAAYAGALSLMFAASTRVDPAVPRGARRKLVAGSALFLASDALLAGRRFVLPASRLGSSRLSASAAADGAVMAAYTAGQGLIAAGVADAIRARSGR
jgi:uncharacterized membrane protein YhhN